VFSFRGRGGGQFVALFFLGYNFKIIEKMLKKIAKFSNLQK
jgi:hypothetical protein